MASPSVEYWPRSRDGSMPRQYRPDWNSSELTLARAAPPLVVNWRLDPAKSLEYRVDRVNLGMSRMHKVIGCLTAAVTLVLIAGAASAQNASGWDGIYAGIGVGGGSTKACSTSKLTGPGI